MKIFQLQVLSAECQSTYQLHFQRIAFNTLQGQMWRLASNVLRFCSRVDKVAALGCIVAHKVNHNSGIEHTTGKVEGSGPAPINIELENN